MKYLMKISPLTSPVVISFIKYPSTEAFLEDKFKVEVAPFNS